MMSIKATQQKQLGQKDETGNVARHLLDLEILFLLSPEPKSGYQLKKHLLNSFHINISYGTLYPHLHSLEKAKLIYGIWNSQDANEPLKKKTYSLTTLGAEKLRAGVQSLGKIALSMQFSLAGSSVSLHEFKQHEGAETAFKAAIQFMSEGGYSAKSAVMLRGSSGVEYPIEIFASRFDNRANRNDKLILKVLNSGSGATLDDILRLSVMSYDVQATKTVVLSVPGVSEEVLRLAEFCQISIYSGKDLSEAVSNMCASMNLN
jgi:DNA-binding PadR family transcriptional regulator